MRSRAKHETIKERVNLDIIADGQLASRGRVQVPKAGQQSRSLRVKCHKNVPKLIGIQLITRLQRATEKAGKESWQVITGKQNEGIVHSYKGGIGNMQNAIGAQGVYGIMRFTAQY